MYSPHPRHRAPLLSVLACLLLSLSAAAYGAGSERGVLFGDNHAFAITAPPGWVLDNRSGVHQGIDMAFYPAGNSWSDSPVVAYGRSRTWDKRVHTVAQQVAATVRQFHDSGSPGYHARRGSPLTLTDGRRVPIYRFSGDQWGNVEAGAYFPEKSTLNYLIYTARDRAHFKRYWPQFLQLVRSYENVLARIEGVSKARFAALSKAADKESKTKAGSAYESKDLNGLGNRMAGFMRSCSHFLKGGALKNFHLYAQVMPDGTTGRLYVSPHNSSAVCFAAGMLSVRHRRHHFTPYYPLVIDMKIAP